MEALEIYSGFLCTPFICYGQWPTYLFLFFFRSEITEFFKELYFRLLSQPFLFYLNDWNKFRKKSEEAIEIEEQTIRITFCRITPLQLSLTIPNVHSPSLTFSNESTWFFFFLPKGGRILKSWSGYSTNLNQELACCTLRIVLQNPRHPLTLWE